MRANGQPIEDIGVHPDIEYSPTVEDLQGGYADYRNALLNTVRKAWETDRSPT